jgi:hypothetical protein
MRHPYTPLFRDFLTSSMWAAEPATRCIWIWFLLMADPEGFVVGTVPGVAQQAGVTLEQAKAAIEMLESPDAYSSTPDLDGRRLVKVARGWHIVNFVSYRERAKLEAEKARKRTWAQKKRAEQLSLPFPEPETVDGASTCVDISETIDAPKPKQKLFSSSSSSTAREGEPLGSWSLVLKELPADMVLPEELEAEARAAGVEDPRRWFDKLKEGPIGGDRGVLAHQLDTYLRRLIGSWRTWEETERAKSAQRQAQAASPRRFGDSPLPVDPFEPDASQRAFAKKHGLDLGALLKGVLADYPQPSQNMSRRGVLGERLTVACKQKLAGQPVTGKLTRDQAALWGSVPPGGAIPEVA